MWFIVFLLVFLWAVGGLAQVGSYFINILLVLAILFAVVEIVRGRRV